MGYFQDAGEVYRYIGRLIEELVADPDLVATFREVDAVVQYRHTHPDAVITTAVTDDGGIRVDCGETDLDPEIVLTTEADTAHRFWLGQLNVTVALARGEVTAQGPVTRILKLLPVVTPAFTRYQTRLREAGREDLLEPVAEASSPPG